MDTFIAVLGTLLGYVLGAVGIHVNQTLAHQSAAAERLTAVRHKFHPERALMSPRTDFA